MGTMFFSVVLAAAVLPVRPLQVSREMPVRTVKNGLGHTVHDFGRDGFGWLEINAAATGTCFLVYGEKLGSDDVVDRYLPRNVRVAAVRWNIERTGWQRVPFAPDIRNLFPAGDVQPIDITSRFGIVAPFRAVETVSAPFPLDESSYRRCRLAYPLDMTESSFTCSDRRLCTVWEFCKYSLWSTSFTGYIVDGDRERIPYEADTYSTQMALYGICSDYAYARRTVEYLYSHPTWPTEFKQSSIMSAWADWMYTGDLFSVRRHYDVLKNEKLLMAAARETDGLLVTGGGPFAGTSRTNEFGYADIVDWPASERDGFEFRPVNAVVNAFHFRNLGEMADIASALGKTADAEMFRSRAALVKRSYVRTFFNPASGLFTDGEGSSHSSIHVNAAALAFGLAPEGSRAEIAKWLVGRGMACSVYFSNYLLRALFENGRGKEAITLMTAEHDRSWLGMLAQGATMTMESWNAEVKPNLDWNHSWAAVPAGMAARYICGVRPLEPGFAKILVRPETGDLTEISAKIPTARGPVMFDCKDGVLTLDLPAPAKVIWRGRETHCGKGRAVLK